MDHHGSKQSSARGWLRSESFTARGEESRVKFSHRLGLRRIPQIFASFLRVKNVFASELGIRHHKQIDNFAAITQTSRRVGATTYPSHISWRGLSFTFTAFLLLYESKLSLACSLKLTRNHEFSSTEWQKIRETLNWAAKKTNVCSRGNYSQAGTTRSDITKRQRIESRRS